MVTGRVWDVATFLWAVIVDQKDVVLEDDSEGPAEPVFLASELLRLPLHVSHVRPQQLNLRR